MLRNGVAARILQIIIMYTENKKLVTPSRT